MEKFRAVMRHVSMLVLVVMFVLAVLEGTRFIVTVMQNDPAMRSIQQ